MTLSTFSPIKRQRFVSEIIKIKDLTPTVKEYILSVPPEFTFYAGQFITLRFKINMMVKGEMKEKIVGRAYSISSPPEQLSKKIEGKHTLELCIKLVEDGVVTPSLFSDPPKEVNVVGPMGKFFLNEEDRNKELVFIATGTGIAPFKSMIEDLITDYSQPITLLTGVRYENEILYPELWEEYEKQFPIFKHQSIVSRPKSPDYAAGNPVGRVTHLVPDYIKDPKEEQLFIICGLTPMIDGVRAILLAKGIQEKHIRFEKYD